VKSPRITWISSDDPPNAFPDIDNAFDVPDGLLAAGGDLSEERLLYAYAHGIFPWFNEGQPILWWSPDPRCILRPGEIHIPRRLRRSLRQSDFNIRFNSAFEGVIARCAEERPGQDSTWITQEMHAAYCGLHRSGWAHSIEVWSSGHLVGGLYGIAIDRIFFGESMFSRQTNASKAAMVALCYLLTTHDFKLLDCQVESPHLRSLGATLMPRSQFSAVLKEFCRESLTFDDWPTKPCQINEFLV
jgi:leucyl/phenylalanyl-tRNA--protein transferase